MWAADGTCFETLEEVAIWHLSKAALPSGHVLESFTVNIPAESITYAVQGSATGLTIYPPACDLPGSLASYTGLTLEDSVLISFAVLGLWAAVWGVMVIRRAL